MSDFNPERIIAPDAHLKNLVQVETHDDRKPAEFIERGHDPSIPTRLQRRIRMIGNRFSLLKTMLVLMFIMISLIAPVQTLAATSPSVKVPVLTWSDCGGGFQCATATVPLDYDSPQDGTISLALIRLPLNMRLPLTRRCRRRRRSIITTNPQCIDHHASAAKLSRVPAVDSGLLVGFASSQ